MNAKFPTISDAELQIMNIIWQSETPLSSQEIIEKLPQNNTWKKPTVTTLIGRLVEKGALLYTQKGRYYEYTAAIDDKTYKAVQTKLFMDKLHGNSVKSLVAALYSGKQVSEKELHELKTLFGLKEE